MLYIIVNYNSAGGKCRNVLKKVTERLKIAEIEYKLYRTKYEGHATEIAKKISNIAAETATIFVIGGDGTINEILNGITDFDKVRLGIIPAGSGNDFARGINTDSDIDILLEKLLANYSEGKTRRVDLGRVSFGDSGSRLFGISSGVGMDAIVCRKVSESRLKKLMNTLHLGKLSYIIMTVYTLFSMETFDITADYGKENKHIKDVIYFVGMNLRAEGGGVPMAPDARPDDGMISFSSAAGIPKWRTFLCLPFLVMARQKMLKGFDTYTSDHAVITTEKPVILHTDGEYLGQYKHIEYECLPGKLIIVN